MRLLPLILLPMAAPSAWADGWSYEGGVSVATGRYVFTERSTALLVSGGVSYSAGPFTLRASVPWVIERGDLVTATAIGFVPGGGGRGDSISGGGRGGSGREGRTVVVDAATASVWRSGVGDPTASVAWTADGPASTALSISAAVKAPVAQAGDLGTGAWDVGGTVALTRPLGARASLGASASHWRLGDLPDLVLLDPWRFAVDLTHHLGPAWAVSAGFAASTATLEGYAPPRSLSASVLHFAGWGSVGGSLGFGLTNTASQVSGGLSWSVPIAGGL